MNRFGVTSLTPRAIAWFVRPNEWERLERIVKYNCAMTGGYFNVLIKVEPDSTISANYLPFLRAFDPDIVVLAPEMDSTAIEYASLGIHPFGIVAWEEVGQIASMDPWGSSSGVNATLPFSFLRSDVDELNLKMVAGANSELVDASRLALLACGDIQAREPMLHVMDEEMELDATGFRERFLRNLLKEGCTEVDIEAHLNDRGELVRAPNREKLASVIEEKYLFPLTGATRIIDKCCSLQHLPILTQSFIGLTTGYVRSGGSPHRFTIEAKLDYPTVVIQVSDKFSFEEALLFWNLRANQIHVAWISFSELEKDISSVAKWIDSDYGGEYYAMVSQGHTDIAFSTNKENLDRLQSLIEKEVQPHREASYLKIDVVLGESLLSYSTIRPSLKKEHVVVNQDGLKGAFVAGPPDDGAGTYCVTLEWDGLMVPQDATLVKNLISDASLGFPRFSRVDGKIQMDDAMRMPRFRINSDRYLRIQVSEYAPIEFNLPSANDTIGLLLRSAGISRVELSSAGNYQKDFLTRSGSLGYAAKYLNTPPYKGLLELLANNRDANLPGWLLEHPDKRRVLNHFQLRQVLGSVTPPETDKYFNTVSDELPIVAFELLEKGILERGFRLRCRFCSYQSWYPVDHVKQKFECARCFQLQVYDMNPLWLYRLREVTFQGLQDHMEVPILATAVMQKTAKHTFEWDSDSNVYWLEGEIEKRRNVDLLFLCDGQFLLGEAKSNDEIEADQIALYTKIAKIARVDKLVFATSCAAWKPSTRDAIKNIEQTQGIKTLMLEGSDLYSK